MCYPVRVHFIIISGLKGTKQSYIEPNLDIKMVISNSKPFNYSSQVASFTARFTILKSVYWWYLSVVRPAGSGYLDIIDPK